MDSNNRPLNFALIGAAGYIAPRHMIAIKETENRLVAALDPCDSIGIIDSHFPNAEFFLEPERFDRHLDKLRRLGDLKVDYVSICSPNYLHDAHIRMSLRSDAHAISEKPLVINPWNIEMLEQIEKETGKNIYNILQLRLHPSIIALKKDAEAMPKDNKQDIDLTYITSRGNWYHVSWKGSVEKSGGIATNIGVHFFDMLTWIFGSVKSNIVHLYEKNKASGFLELEHARIRWYLSIDSEDLPVEIKEKGIRTFRTLTMNGKSVEFSDGFTGLHTLVYKDILSGGGFRLADTRQSIETVYEIRNLHPVGKKGDYHPFLNNKNL
ncbi:MAG: Gfo/Idh/MocA family oxidoreductase [Bacteroidetes bacterium]|nr:Gfo/Idh/MocA family oxidoreductase [Bacteroidota bacterium]